MNEDQALNNFMWIINKSIKSGILESIDQAIALNEAFFVLKKLVDKKEVNTNEVVAKN